MKEKIEEILEYHSKNNMSYEDTAKELSNLLTKSNEEAVKQVWINYSDRKPELGRLVACYRDVESKQIFVTKWSKDDENFADMNEITHWIPLSYPTQQSLDKEQNI